MSLIMSDSSGSRPRFGSIAIRDKGSQIEDSKLSKWRSRLMSTFHRGPSDKALDERFLGDRNREDGELPSNRYLTILELIVSYVPRSLLKRFLAQCTALTKHEIEPFQATILFVDISGFTQLNERLATLAGGEGPEVVTKHLNAYFSELIKRVHHHGGDILKFAGDALICVFGTTSMTGLSVPNKQRQRNIKDLTRNAVDCAIDIQNNLSRYDCNGITLTLHMGVGTGDVYSLIVGGVDGCWEYILAGEPFNQLKSSVEESVSGEVVVSQKTWELLKGYFKGKQRGKNWLITSKLKNIKAAVSNTLPDISNAPENLETIMLGFVNRGLASFLEQSKSKGGGDIYDFIDDLRMCTVLFVSLQGLVYNPKVKFETETIQQALCIMQQVVFSLEGVVRQFLVDDKGTVLIAGFGIPPFYHEDDCLRGTQAALRIHSALEKVGIQCSIGVTTGKVFCGTVGNYERREYTLVGDIVNLSARLMVAAKGSVLCDRATYLGACNKLKFEECPPISVKGKKHPVHIYKPSDSPSEAKRHSIRIDFLDVTNSRRITNHISNLHYSVNQLTLSSRNEKICLGRDKESKIIDGLIRRAMIGEGSVSIIEGEAGMGKTMLLTRAVNYATANEMKVIMTEADSIDKETPYLLWQNVFTDLLGLGGGGSAEVKIVNRLEYYLQSAPNAIELREYLPLLNVVLNTKFPDTPLIEEHCDEKGWRQESLFKVLLHFLKVEALKQPLLLVIDNAQWMDSASVAFTHAALDHLTTVCFLFGMRPLSGRALTVNKYLYEMEKVTRIKLEPLSNENVSLLAGKVLACNPQTLPKAMLKFLEKANGNPLFIKEISLQLKDNGVVAVKQSECVVTGDLSTMQLPENIQGLIMSKIDKLPPMEKLVLKVASVIGNEFSVESLTQIYPIPEDKAQIPTVLDNLVDNEILSLVSTKLEAGANSMFQSFADLVSYSSSDVYMFQSSIISQGCYNMMTFAQRQQFHRSYAEWVEKSFGQDEPHCLAALTHHWTKAAQAQQAEDYVLVKAIDYLLARSTKAWECSATPEALKFLEKAGELLNFRIVL
eukprot:TRINITY_DN2884_c0_g1_i3.p1 TRINITY_DN2884_c0_g1~~TRINITY_DN2884_c0_g1_i3.p1  ORF type:complete len:1058 (-),score=225.70 TRINITY_DN2884_c0_g1_i3:735-3908(-)